MRRLPGHHRRMDTAAPRSAIAHRLPSLLVALALCVSAGCRDSSGSSVDEPAQVSDEEAVATLVEGLSGEWNVADVLERVSKGASARS